MPQLVVTRRLGTSEDRKAAPTEVITRAVTGILAERETLPNAPGYVEGPGGS